MNICVIGLGSMGKRRIRLLKLLVSNAVIIGIDSNIERVQNVAKEYKIECSQTLESRCEHFEYAFICTSPRSHGMLIRECLLRDCHVFSEINLLDDMYQENINMAIERGKTLFLSSTPIYKEEMRFIHKRVRKSKKACIYQYHVGQYLPDWHPWDNLNDFFVSNKVTNGCRELLAIELPWIQHTFGKIKKVYAIKKKLTSLNLDFPDTYIIQIDHENGTYGNLMIDVVSRQAVRILEVLNEDIYIRWNGTPDSLYEKDILSGEFRQVELGEYVNENGYSDFINEIAYAKEIEEFFNVVQGEKSQYSFEQDLETLEWINEIEK